MWNNAIKPSFISDIELTYIECGVAKERTYKEAWAIAWSNATDSDKQLLYALPNFDWEIFTAITGIKEE